MIDHELKNKTVIITGGSGQVGCAVASNLARLGATVIAIVRRDVDKAQSKMKKISKNCSAILADVTDYQSLLNAANEIKKCDILINAAGYTTNLTPVNLNDLSEELFDKIIDTNLKGTFLSIRAFRPIMDNGVIINISSTAGLRASQSNLAYGAAKAGIDLLTKTLAKSLAPKIRVVGIAPGFLVNPTSGAIKPPGANEKIAELTPLKRVGQAEDIAQMIESVIFNNHITGQTIVVDGGITL